MDKKQFYIFLAAISIILLFIHPFIKYILFGFVLFVLSRPIYLRINKFGKLKKYYRFNAAFSILFIVFLFVLTVFVIFSYIYKDLISILVMLYKTDLSSISIPSNIPYREFLILAYPYLKNIINSLTLYIYNLLSSMPKEVIGYFLSFLVSYYILVYEDKIEESIRDVFGFSLYTILDKSYSVLAGHFLLWGIQAIMSFVGFYIMGIKYSILLSILVFLFAVLPILGPWTIWGSIAIYEFIRGNIDLSIFSIVYGIIIVSIVTEIVVKPYLLGRLSDINPLIVFLGIIGGVNLFGIPGLIIGPILLEISKDILLSYRN